MLTTRRHHRHGTLHLRGAVPVLGLTLALWPGLAAAPADAHVLDPVHASSAAMDHQGSPAARAAIPSSVSKPIQVAQTALARAAANLRKHHNVKARAALRIVSLKVAQANRSGAAQIGRPPTDPESDDPPGPPSVLAVLRLEHRVGTEVVSLFNNRKAPKVVGALRHTLVVTHTRRDNLLHAVIALPPEGAGADYADGMADTVNIYKQEVTQVTGALNRFKLTGAARIGLRHALTRVKATKARVDAAFGGGE